MVKNTLKYILTVFLSIFSVYILSDKIILPYILHVDEVAVPNLIGHNISTAKILLDKNRLKMNIQYVTSDKDDIIGRIIDVHPSSDFYFDSNKNSRYDKDELFIDKNGNKKYDQKIVKVGTSIHLKVLGEKESYILPNLLLKSKNIGVNILKSMRIKIDTIVYDYWNTLCADPRNMGLNELPNSSVDYCIKYKKNIIWDQFPMASEKIFKNEGVTLYISKGEFAPELYDVPNLIDLNLEQAIDLINKSGLLLGNITYLSDSANFKGKVIDQSLFGKCRITEKINLIIE